MSKPLPKIRQKYRSGKLAQPGQWQGMRAGDDLNNQDGHVFGN